MDRIKILKTSPSQSERLAIYLRNKYNRENFWKIMTFDSTSETLIQRVKNRIDQKSWEEFVSFYKPYLFAVINNTINNHHDSEDLVQRALLPAGKKIPEYIYTPGKSRFRSWLCSKARNYSLNYLRDNGRYLAKLDNFKADTEEEIVSELAKLEDREWKLYISSLAWENIKADFEGKALDCFMLMSDGMSANLVADKLQISPGSVYVLKKESQKSFIGKSIDLIAT